MRTLRSGATVKKNQHDVLEFVTEEDEFKIIWISDAHLDNPKSKTKFRNDLIKENPNAYIIYGGDSHDLMQGREDRRSSKSALKEAFKEDDMWNRIIDSSRKEVIEPIEDRLICMTHGNHTTSLIRKHEFDFLTWLCEGKCDVMDTAGYIIVRHKNKGGKILANNVLYFQHAPPSGGNRSKGMLSADLLLAQRPDADVIISEHIHQTWTHPATVEHLKTNGKPYYKNVWIIQAPTLKAEHEGRRLGYYQEKVKAGATTIGAVALDFKVVRGDPQGSRTRRFVVEPRYKLYYE